MGLFQGIDIIYNLQNPKGLFQNGGWNPHFQCKDWESSNSNNLQMVVWGSRYIWQSLVLTNLKIIKLEITGCCVPLYFLMGVMRLRLGMFMPRHHQNHGYIHLLPLPRPRLWLHRSCMYNINMIHINHIYDIYGTQICDSKLPPPNSFAGEWSAWSVAKISRPWTCGTCGGCAGRAQILVWKFILQNLQSNTLYAL